MDNHISRRKYIIVAKHIETCKECAGEQEEALKLHNLIHSNLVTAPPQLSPSFESSFNRKLNEIKRWERLPVLDKVKERLGIFSYIPVRLRYAIAVVIILIIAVTGIDQILEFNPEINSLQKKYTDNTMYNVIAEKTENKEIKEIANKKAAEIILLAGISG